MKPHHFYQSESHSLEKLCAGFELTPNELLLPPLISQEMSYREPAPVTQIRCSRFLCGMTGFPVCPQCGVTMEREYQPFCDRCGQCLSWQNYADATVILPEK